VRPDWLENMPSTWSSVPFGSIFTQRKKKNYRLQRDFVLSVIKDRGVIPYSEKGNVGNKVSDDLSGYKLVDKGDFVLNSMNLYMGSVGVSDYDGVTSTAYIVCKPSEGVHAGYYNYLIQFKGFQEYVGLLGKGIMEIREAVRWTALKSVFVPLPDFTTQRQIADFLDRETARIDLLVEKKQRLLKLLGEKRSAIVTAAVAGQNRAYGDVGSKRLRFALASAPRAHPKFKRSPGTLVSFAPMDTLVDGLGGLTELETKAFSEVSGGSYNYFENGDVLLAKVTPCFENGKKAIAENLENGAGFATSEVLVFRPQNNGIETRYLRYLFCSEDFRHTAISSMTGAGGLRRVSERAVLDFPLPVLDLPTQRAIADFLDRETTQIEKIQEATQQSIDRLKEYRSALITAAVTGQINVSEWGKSGTNERQLDAIQAEMEH
jgi:type I restriction enzyme S subunit